jgi:hypothetical protein
MIGSSTSEQPGANSGDPEEEGERATKRVKCSHKPEETLATELMFFKNKRLQMVRMQGFAFTSLPVEIIFEVRVVR